MFFMNDRFIQQLISNYKSGFSLEQAFYVNNDVFEGEPLFLQKSASKGSQDAVQQKTKK